MKIHSNFTVNHWSGGTTTELFIYPPESSLKQLDFQFRLSTATIEIETSTFSPLPQVDRTLMMLEGNITLNHQGQHSETLGPFEQDHFQGHWQTESQGTGTDFNLMCREATKGSLAHIHIDKGEKLTVKPSSSTERLFAYLHSGLIHSSDKQQSLLLEARQLLEIEGHEVTLAANDKSDLVLVRVE